MQKASSSVQLVLLDLDGVLVDSFDFWFYLMLAATKEFALPRLTREQFRKTLGQSLEEDVKRFFPSRSVAEVEGYYREKSFQHASHLKAADGAALLASILRRKNIATAVVTNTPRAIARNILAACNIRHDLLVTATDVPKPKPAPDMLLRACETLQIRAANSVFVGDSIFDQQAARSAHIPFIGFGIPGDFMIRRLPELGSILGVAFDA